MKKVFLTAIFGVLAVVLLAASPALAEWYTCEIVSVGQAGNYYYIKLSDTEASPAFSNRWFVLQPNQGKSMAAIALAAAAANKTVNVNLYPDSAGYSLVTAIYLIK